MISWKDINRLNRTRDAYLRLFMGSDGRLKPDAEIVLKDLRKWCRANGVIGYRTSHGMVDPIAMANANGRREVWDRVMRYLHLPDRKVVELQVPTDESEF